MVDGVHGHHVQLVVVVALKPAHVHVQLQLMVVLIALALILNLATLVLALCLVLLVPILPPAPTFLVKPHVLQVPLDTLCQALVLLHKPRALPIPHVLLAQPPSLIAYVSVDTLDQLVVHVPQHPSQ